MISLMNVSDDTTQLSTSHVHHCDRIIISYVGSLKNFAIFTKIPPKRYTQIHQYLRPCSHFINYICPAFLYEIVRLGWAVARPPSVDKLLFNLTFVLICSLTL